MVDTHTHTHSHTQKLTLSVTNICTSGPKTRTHKLSHKRIHAAARVRPPPSPSLSPPPRSTAIPVPRHGAFVTTSRRGRSRVVTRRRFHSGHTPVPTFAVRVPACVTHLRRLLARGSHMAHTWLADATDDARAAFRPSDIITLSFLLAWPACLSPRRSRAHAFV